MDDVIGQGREPERDVPPGLSRRRRVVARTLVGVVAAAAVTGIGLQHVHHDPGAADSSASSATAGTGAAAGRAGTSLLPAAVLPVPQAHPAAVICAPSTGACSMRLQGQPGLA